MAEASSIQVNPREVLNSLFGRAKAKDEFEYICALSGMDVAGHGFNLLAETWALHRDLLGLLHAPLRDDTRLRLGLLLYCHLLEAKPVYALLDNMLSAAEGDRCAIDPFFNLARKKKKDAFLPEWIPPSAKKVFEVVTQHARKAGEDQVAAMLEAVFDEGLRNAFFHADYCIVGDTIHSRHAWFRDGDVRSQAIKANAALSRIQNGLALYEAFETVYIEHRLSYQEPKKIKGRFGPNDSWVDIYVYADPDGGGLTGFGNMPEPPTKQA